ncbi:cyclic peptide export ABC transporter [Glaciimonas sp. GNP009]
MAKNIINLFKGAPQKNIRSVGYLTCLTGLSGMILISLINLAAQQTASGQIVSGKLRFLYLLGFALFVLVNRESLSEANCLLQKQLALLRLRIADKIRRSELRSVEQLGNGEIYATLVKESDQLSQNFTVLISAGQGMFLLAFSLLYIAYLSFPAFLLVSLSTLGALYFFYIRRQALDAELVDVYVDEMEMLESLNHFTHGFQEIRINAAKNDALYRRYEEIVNRLEKDVVNVGSGWVVLLMFGNSFLYILLGAIVFILPMFFHGYTDIIYKITSISFFCVGPVAVITAALPIYARSDSDLGRILQLEKKLEAGEPDVQKDDQMQGNLFQDFKEIKVSDLRFTYQNQYGEPGFSSGPVNMEIQRGEIIFVRGGNGSGKSTLMKLLCGLYRPDHTAIEVDGSPVSRDNLQQYREIFTCIFPDFHLFDRFHGIENVDYERARALIKRMELTGKVDISDNGFSTLDLSTGQRKRLAMIVALLEDCEIFMFDEWAADQDAHFREFFYEQILPDLKRRNKTVIAVTHDEQYWHLCDRLYTLDLGVMTLEPASHPSHLLR